MQHWCACSDSPGGVSPRNHTHFPRQGRADQMFPFGEWDTSRQAMGVATLRTPMASAQGLIYQRDRSRSQGLPQKSAGLEMQRTKIL